MTEREAEQVLRRWFDEEVGRSRRASASLQDRVTAIPRTRSVEGLGNHPRSLLLIAAVLMLSSILAIGLAAGSGLVHLPTAFVEPSPTATPAATLPTPSPSLEAESVLLVEDEPLWACPRELHDQVVLDFSHEGDPQGPDLRLVVYDDGIAAKGPTGYDPENPAVASALGRQWQQRRLTAAGLEMLVDTLADASLPTCQSIYTGEGEWGRLTAKLPGGVLEVNTGHGGPRTPTEAESTAAAQLVEHLTDLDAWIPRELWLDEKWQDREPQPWELGIPDPWAPVVLPPTPDDALPDLNPCDYVPESVYPVFGIEREYSSPQGRDWVHCWFYARGDIGVSMRMRPTSSEQAASYARSLFGDTGFSSESIADGTVYFNGCANAPVRGCTAAIAVSADPYLFLFTGGQYTRLEWLYLAEAILEQGPAALNP